MATTKASKKPKKEEAEQGPVKVEVYKKDDEAPKPQSIWNRGFSPVNIFLFMIAALLLAFAIAEPGRNLLDFIAGIVFIGVLVKIAIDGYGIKLGGN
jgi:hypothetical protein